MNRPGTKKLWWFGACGIRTIAYAFKKMPEGGLPVPPDTPPDIASSLSFGPNTGE